MAKCKSDIRAILAHIVSNITLVENDIRNLTVDTGHDMTRQRALILTNKAKTNLHGAINDLKTLKVLV